MTNLVLKEKIASNVLQRAFKADNSKQKKWQHQMKRYQALLKKEGIVQNRFREKIAWTM